MCCGVCTPYSNPIGSVHSCKERSSLLSPTNVLTRQMSACTDVGKVVGFRYEKRNRARSLWSSTAESDLSRSVIRIPQATLQSQRRTCQRDFIGFGLQVYGVQQASTARKHSKKAPQERTARKHSENLRGVAESRKSDTRPMQHDHRSKLTGAPLHWLYSWQDQILYLGSPGTPRRAATMTPTIRSSTGHLSSWLVSLGLLPRGLLPTLSTTSVRRRLITPEHISLEFVVHFARADGATHASAHCRKI